MTSDGDDEDKFSPLVVPVFMKNRLCQAPREHVGGRDGSRALDRSFAVRDNRTESDRAFCYLSSHCSKNGAPNFFSFFVLFLPLPKDVTFVKLAAQIFSAVVAPSAGPARLPPKIRKTHETNGREVGCFNG